MPTHRSFRRFSLSLQLALLTFLSSAAFAADWPMWRHDPQRTGTTDQALPSELHVQWVRQNPPLKPAFRNPRLQFDKGYEPIVVGKTLFYGSSRNDSVTALDTDTGYEKWQFFTDGPVRFAPAALDGKIYVGSDDGHLYCLDGATGNLRWKFRAAPSRRKILGNGRMISVWPVRGGPVALDGKVYFAAGVWPMEGVFVYALDAETGDVVWLNDSSAFLYGQHPHDAKAFGGLSPQGYLVINGDELIVPGGAAVPATFDLATGKLKNFELPKPGRLPGGWFASIHGPDAKAVRRGKVVHDSDVSSQEHEDRKSRGIGEAGVRTKISANGVDYSFTNKLSGMEGEIHTMLAADDKLFVVALDGSIHCLGSGQERSTPPKIVLPVNGTRMAFSPEQTKSLLERIKSTKGFALVYGLDDEFLIETLVQRTTLNIIGVDPDAEKVARLRNAFNHRGAYGSRVSLLVGSPEKLQLPPYFANAVILNNFDGVEIDAAGAQRIFEPLRPYGGTAYLIASDAQHQTFTAAVEKAQLANASIERQKGLTILHRNGALPGSANYTGDWTSPDQLVKAPLGVLWFDDTVGHFKRSPQPQIVDGVMMSRPKIWEGTDERPYKLDPPIYSDVYTGRVLVGNEAEPKKFSIPENDPPQPTQYRPPGYKGSAYAPPKPVAGERTNPLTGASEPRTFPRSYGCDGGIDYGYMYTMRSGTAAFYDKEAESGIINISGPRSGCSNSVIPANGVLNVPYFYEGCTCSYPIPSGLALFSLPPEHEQWTAWGPGATNDIRRIGINLGAPGDRMTDAGTLWLDHPSVGGPSPSVVVQTEPATPDVFYRHSMFVTGGRGWPWVAASGAQGITAVTLNGLKDMNATVRLYFIEPDNLAPGKRVFDVALQGEVVLKNLDIARETGSSMKSLVKEFKAVRIEGSLNVKLTPIKGQPVLSGVEVIAGDMKAGAIRLLSSRTVDQLTGMATTGAK
jgi:hypothetical protein